MEHLVLGHLGEVGSAMKIILTAAGETVAGIDLDQQDVINRHQKFDVIHVCYPYSQSVDRITITYLISHSKAGTICIVHSSLVPGTMQKIIGVFPSTVYSPVKGMHPDLVSDLEHYLKYYASTDPELLRRTGEIFDKMGIHGKGWLADPVNLEHAKIINLNLHATRIVFAQQVAGLITEKKLDRELIVSFIESTGDRTVLPYAQTMDGHCVHWALTVASDYLALAYQLRILNADFFKRYQHEKLFLKTDD